MEHPCVIKKKGEEFLDFVSVSHLDFVLQCIIAFLLMGSIFAKDQPVFRDKASPTLLYLIVLFYTIESVISIKDKSDIVDFGESVLVVFVFFAAIAAIRYFAQPQR